MKLIFCRSCQDVVQIQLGVDRKCLCGASGGTYVNDVDAEVWGEAIPIGFSNSTFAAALQKRPEVGLGTRFEAFVMPRDCATIRVVKAPEERKSKRRP